ncbi:fucolectin-4-like [Acanthaster planci]|uniref:Fucolectin-4-like n=1 Tax=Acanthaster planci TaxID=133434 RepID=A0A8B7YUN2_ACAPL|nr:fucolectin-4-like [Acanthaster planci]
MVPRDHLRLSVVLLVVFILHEGLSLDLRGSAVVTTQSSVYDANPLYARFAVDRDLGTFSHTGFDTPEERTNPWWKVDLGYVYCLRKITLVNVKDLGKYLGVSGHINLSR